MGDVAKRRIGGDPKPHDEVEFEFDPNDPAQRDLAEARRLTAENRKMYADWQAAQTKKQLRWHFWSRLGLILAVIVVIYEVLL